MFEADQQGRWRDQNAPPPSSLDTNHSSQQTHNPIEGNRGDKANEAEEPASQRSVEGIPGHPDILFARPGTLPTEPDTKIDLVVSYDVIPGLNVPFYPDGDIFAYSLEKLLSQVNWGNEHEAYLVCLQAPAASPATHIQTWMDLVVKDEADRFEVVLRRFKQTASKLRSDYTRMKTDAVIEIAFEPVVEGHTHSALVKAWYNAGRAHGAKL